MKYVFAWISLNHDYPIIHFGMQTWSVNLVTILEHDVTMSISYKMFVSFPV